MAVSDADYAHAFQRVPTLAPLRFGNDIYKVTAQMKGIIGHGNTAPRVYDVVMTFDNYPEVPPIAWILAPPDAEIRHMNIFHPDAPMNLPHVCMGSYESKWKEIPLHDRCLLHFLLALNQVLLNENPNSPARR